METLGVVFVVMQTKDWPGSTETVRVFDNIEAARADCVQGQRSFLQKPLLSTVVCPQCGK